MSYHIYLNIRQKLFPNSQSEKGGCLIIVYKVKHILCGKGECFCSSMARGIKQLHSCCSNVNSDSLQDISNTAIKITYPHDQLM